MQDRKPGLNIDIVAALVAFVVLLLVFQYRTLTKFIVLSPGVSFANLGLYVDTVRQEVALDVVDGVLFLLLLVPVCYILFLEISRQRLTVFLSWIFEDERRTLLALGIASLVSVRYYFAPGLLSWAGDAPQHISYLDITTQILSDFELPIWTNYFGAGSPFLQFYGFLYFLVGGVVNLVVGNVDLAGKLGLGASHAASGIGVFVLCRNLRCSRQAAFLAGLAYVLCFWHTQHVLVMGRHPVGLFYALLPWPFAFLERGLRAPVATRELVTGGLCHAALVFTHPGYGLYATAFLAGYVLLRSLERRDVVTVYRGGCLIAVGLLVSLPHTLPMAVERAHTKLSLGWSLASNVGPTLHHLLGWSNYRFRLFPLPPDAEHWYGGYLGLTLVLIAAAGIVLATRKIRRHRPRYLAVHATTVLAFVLPFAISSEWFEDVPLLPNLSAVRYLLFTAFFVSVSVGVGARFLSGAALGKRRSRRYTVLLALVLLDLGPTTFQQPYMENLPERGDVLPGGEINAWRNYFLLRGRNPYDAMTRSQFSLRTPTARAPHPGDLLVQTHFVEPLDQTLEQVLPESEADIDWDQLGLHVTGFRMLNVRDVYLEHPHIARLGWNTPVLVSARTVPLPAWDRQLAETIPSDDRRRQVNAISQNPEDAGWVTRSIALLWTLGRSTIDQESGACENIVLTGAGEAVDLGTNPACTVVVHRVWNTRVRIRLSVTEQCFARLAYGYFPYLNVTVDGEPVTPLVTMGRFMAVPLSAGEHVIEIEAGLSPLRKMLWILVIGLVVGWFGWGRRMLALRTG